MWWLRLPSIIKTISALVIGLALVEEVTKVFNKKVFISFAIEDVRFRDLLVGQSKHDKTPFEFIDMSVKEPWDSAWKTKCRDRIKSCHGMVVLVSRHTRNADGALWEIRCAEEEKIPVMAMYITEDRNFLVPKELEKTRLNVWSWQNLEKFVSGL